VLTLNNYTQDEYKSLTEWFSPQNTKWAVIAKEAGDLNQTPHLQGAIVFKSQRAFSNLKKIPGLSRAHFEEMHGSPQQSLDYCTKEDSDPFLFGTLPAPGKRSDIHDVVDQLKTGTSIKKLVEETSSAVCYVRYSRGLTLLRQQFSRVRDPNKPPTIFWFHGPTGTNKTRAAFALSELLSPDEPAWISSGPLKWFDGYDGQRSVIFDDLRTSDSGFSYLLRLLDRYPIQVEIKGGYANWCPEHIFVTCPKCPRDLWSLRTEEQLDQLSRRVSRQISFPPSRVEFESLVLLRPEWNELLPKLGELFELFWGDVALPTRTIDLSGPARVGSLPTSNSSGVYRCTGTTPPSSPGRYGPSSTSSTIASMGGKSPLRGPDFGIGDLRDVPSLDDGWPAWDDIDDPDDPFVRFLL